VAKEVQTAAKAATAGAATGAATAMEEAVTAGAATGVAMEAATEAGAATVMAEAATVAAQRMSDLSGRSRAAESLSSTASRVLKRGVLCFFAPSLNWGFFGLSPINWSKFQAPAKTNEFGDVNLKTKWATLCRKGGEQSLGKGVDLTSV